MEQTTLNEGKFLKRKLKGIVLDEVKWGIEIMFVLIILYGLLTIAGLSASDIFEFIGNGVSDLAKPIFNSAIQFVSDFIVGIINAVVGGLASLYGLFTGIICSFLPDLIC